MTFRVATVAVALDVPRSDSCRCRCRCCCRCRCGCGCGCRCSESPLMAPRRWCRNRIKKRPLSERSEFGRFPISVPAAWGPRVAGRHLRGRLFLVTSFGEAKEVTRLPGRTPAWSSGRTSALLHPPADVSREAAFDVGNGRTTQGARAASDGRVKRGRPHCRGDKPGLGPAADLLLLRRQEK